MNNRKTERILEVIRERYYNRRKRFDADEKGQWVTTEKGHHVHLNEEGDPDKGNPHVINQMEGKEKPKSEENSFGKKSGAESGSAKRGYVNSGGKQYVSRADIEGSDVGLVKSGKGGDFSAKSVGSRTIDTSDAIKEFKEGVGGGKPTPNSLQDQVDENGNLSAERQKVHDEIVANYFKEKVKYNGTPTMTMSGGGPASGKSFVTKNAEKKFGADTVVKIDPDEIKAMLPGYQKMAEDYYESGEKTQSAAAYYHEESSALAKRVYQYALENGVNAVYDGTGDGSVNSVRKKIEQARAQGYKVSGEYVTVDTDEALRRNQSRYENGAKKYEAAKKAGKKNDKGQLIDGEGNVIDPPRKPHPDLVQKTHAAVSDILPQVADMFDTITLTDNNGDFGAEKPIIATCEKGGKLKAVKGQEDKLLSFLNKGEKGYKLDKDGTVISK